jgi:hypothetical protein
LTVDPSGVIVSDGVKPGIMQVVMAQDATTSMSRRSSFVALNVDPAACDPQRNDAARLTAWLNQTITTPAVEASTDTTARSSTRASVWLLLAAAVVILAETLLGRMFSVPEPSST